MAEQVALAHHLAEREELVAMFAHRAPATGEVLFDERDSGDRAGLDGGAQLLEQRHGGAGRATHVELADARQARHLRRRHDADHRIALQTALLQQRHQRHGEFIEGVGQDHQPLRRGRR